MSKRPTAASQKKVTAENLARLGAERLAEILVAQADSRPDLKRRLRMELAAEQGAEHLLPEIDKRLTKLETSRSKISWRQRNTFIRDLEGLRVLIVERLKPLDAAAATDRMIAFVETAAPIAKRARDRDGRLAAVFHRAAADLSAMAADADPEAVAGRLAAAILRAPANWPDWLPKILVDAPPELAGALLRRLVDAGASSPGLVAICRVLAGVAGEVDAYRATFTAQAMRTPGAAADVATRLLAAGRVEEAGEVLAKGRPATGKLFRAADAPEAAFAWEGAWIDFLERSGKADEAQAARWASFERSLSVERARGFTSRLTGFADVEAEDRALAYAASHADFELGLGFLMEWPAHREAAHMIAARPDEATLEPETAELWAGRLRARYPAAAEVLLRKAAAAAFRRREFATCDRLTAEADAIEP